MEELNTIRVRQIKCSQNLEERRQFQLREIKELIMGRYHFIPKGRDLNIWGVEGS